MKNREIHGLRNTKLYSVWNAMRNRCYNVNDKEYKRYGARGISVHDRWLDSFFEFYCWAMSNGHGDNVSLDRIDNEGNYEPNNCRFADFSTQTINQRLRTDNKSGYKGIDYLAKKKKWRARIKLKGIEYSLGNYVRIEDAIQARNSFIVANNLPHKIQESETEA